MNFIPADAITLDYSTIHSSIPSKTQCFTHIHLKEIIQTDTLYPLLIPYDNFKL